MFLGNGSYKNYGSRMRHTLKVRFRKLGQITWVVACTGILLASFSRADQPAPPNITPSSDEPYAQVRPTQDGGIARFIKRNGAIRLTRPDISATVAEHWILVTALYHPAGEGGATYRVKLTGPFARTIKKITSSADDIAKETGGLSIQVSSFDGQLLTRLQSSTCFTKTPPVAFNPPLAKPEQRDIIRRTWARFSFQHGQEFPIGEDAEQLTDGQSVIAIYDNGFSWGSSKEFNDLSKGGIVLCDPASFELEGETTERKAATGDTFEIKTFNVSDWGSAYVILSVSGPASKLDDFTLANNNELHLMPAQSSATIVGNEIGRGYLPMAIATASSHTLEISPEAFEFDINTGVGLVGWTGRGESFSQQLRALVYVKPRISYPFKVPTGNFFRLGWMPMILATAVNLAPGVGLSTSDATGSSPNRKAVLVFDLAGLQTLPGEFFQDFGRAVAHTISFGAGVSKHEATTYFIALDPELALSFYKKLDEVLKLKIGQ